MKILWCEEHGSAGYQEGLCLVRDSSCRMVPMRLIPDNAETVERIAKALWVAPLHGEPEGVYVHRMAKAVLAALDGETP